jgi:hypothetical protein
MEDAIQRLRIRVLPDGRVSRADAAVFLGMTEGTMRNWACRGVGPLVRKVGGKAFYRFRDLEAFRDTGAREAPPQEEIGQ